LSNRSTTRALDAWIVRFAQLLHGERELVAGFS
jgi:hypothetical protein